MEAKDWERRKKTARTPFATAPRPSPREVVDALMDPERTLNTKKEVTVDAE